MTEKHPVEENNIVYFHTIEHYEKPHEKFSKAEAVFDSVPYAENGRSGERDRLSYEVQQ